MSSRQANRRGEGETRGRGDLVDRPLLRFRNHSYELSENLVVTVVQLIRFGVRKITAPVGKLQPNSRLFCFTFRIAEFANKVCWVSPLSPCFCNVRTNGTGRTAHLIDHRVPFLCWKLFRQLKYLHRRFKSSLINPQFPITADVPPLTIPRVPASARLRVHLVPILRCPSHAGVNPQSLPYTSNARGRPRVRTSRRMRPDPRIRSRRSDTKSHMPGRRRTGRTSRLCPTAAA